MDNRIFLLLGSNLGEREMNLKRARTAISEQVGFISAQSSIYQTAAWGKMDQPDFYNQVVEVMSKLNANEVLEIILGIEMRLGRERKERWGERLIDIDILLMDDTILQTERLTLPHPELANRKFALIPLAEIAPKFVHPVLKKSIEELLVMCKDHLAIDKLR